MAGRQRDRKPAARLSREIEDAVLELRRAVDPAQSGERTTHNRDRAAEREQAQQHGSDEQPPRQLEHRDDDQRSEQ